MELEYQGVKITVTDKGRFQARVNGEHVGGMSLATVKRMINEVIARTMEPFDALEFSEYKNEIKEVRVVSITGGPYGNSFRTTTGHAGLIYPLEDRPVLEELVAYRKETERIASERKATEFAIESRLHRIMPTNKGVQRKGDDVAAK